MNILSLFQVYDKLIQSILNKNPYFYQIEEGIFNIGQELTKDILISIIETIDLAFKESDIRKERYYVKQTRARTIITLEGEITFMMTYYQEKIPDKNGKRKCYSFITDYIGLPKWCKMTDSAEHKFIKCSIDTNMEYASKNAIYGVTTTRQTIARKIRNLNTEQELVIEKAENTPTHLYIEMDEIHCNLQNGKNKIVPAAIVHEGHKEEFVKRKELKNTYHLASATLSYKQLWEHVFNYCNQRYDLDKIQYLFISGDGATGIKDNNLQFPNAINVLDKFHYRKTLNYIFKKESFITALADEYLRANMIKEFKLLVTVQIDKYPHQKKYIIKAQNYLIKNINGIINQQHKEYKCPCSMEAHISHKYARFITSRPFAFSIEGLTSKIQLLNFHANNKQFDFNTYLKFKYNSDDYYKKLLKDDFKTKFRLQSNSQINPLNKYYVDFHVTTSDKYINERFLNGIENNIKFI